MNRFTKKPLKNKNTIMKKLIPLFIATAFLVLVGYIAHQDSKIHAQELENSALQQDKETLIEKSFELTPLEAEITKYDNYKITVEENNKVIKQKESENKDIQDLMYESEKKINELTWIAK